MNSSCLFRATFCRPTLHWALRHAKKGSGEARSGPMLAHKFPDPYVDILKHFASSGFADAEKQGDVSEAIDKTIGKKCVAIRGKTAAANYLALPKPGPIGLGLSGAYLYLELCLLPGAAFTLHFDLLTDAKFVVRVTLSSRFTTIKQVGTVVQIPGAQLAATAGRWTVLAVDLAALTAAVVASSKGRFAALKGLVACCSMNLRAAFTSDLVYQFETLPREFAIPLPTGKAFGDLFEWRWLPAPPAVAPFSAAVSGAPLSAPPTRALKSIGAPAGASPRTEPRSSAADVDEVTRRRRQRSGAAPRALFPTPPKPTAPADPTVLALSRVLGYSGERNGLLVWMKDGRRVLYAAASLLILQELDTGAQRFLIGHTADVCALSAASTSPLIASAQVGALPIFLHACGRGTACTCSPRRPLHFPTGGRLADHPAVGQQHVHATRDAAAARGGPAHPLPFVGRCSARRCGEGRARPAAARRLGRDAGGGAAALVPAARCQGVVHPRASHPMGASRANGRRARQGRGDPPRRGPSARRVRV